eukprot:6207906-Pleurochrysis_carterae.AAC.1
MSSVELHVQDDCTDNDTLYLCYTYSVNATIARNKLARSDADHAPTGVKCRGSVWRWFCNSYTKSIRMIKATESCADCIM